MLILRARITMLLALLPILVMGCAPGHQTSPSALPTQDRISVATYNIRHGVGMDGALDLQRTLDVLASLDADIIALQEVDDQASRSGGVDQAAWLGEKLGMHAAFGSFMDFQGGRYGLAILSRYPIDSRESWRLTDGNEPRVALAIQVTPNQGEPITTVAVHFDWVQDDGYRFTQASETIEHLQALETPWIVFGDFNDTPRSRTMKAFEAIGEVTQKPQDAAATFPAVDPRIEIDFIVVGPPHHWRTHGSSVIDERVASDHRPVTACLILPTTPDQDRRKHINGSR